MSREIVIIVARAKNGVIGSDGKLPWHIPEDLKRFKAMTLGSPMVMGRKTFESLPGLLADRRHIVITRNRSWSATGAEAVRSLEEALWLAGDGRVSIIGGAEIFRLASNIADRVELTEVHEAPSGDTWLEPFEGWTETARDDRTGFSFVTLERRSSNNA